MKPSASLNYPPRVGLANTPTPLTRLDRLSRRLGMDFYLKRDDLTGSGLGGNKVRKLEFILAEALEKGADTVLTCGGAQSNHCRATALAAAQAGLGCLLLLRTPDPASPPPPEANILMDRLAGAEIVWITPDEYRRRQEFFDREAERLRSLGRRPYIIPEGGSTALGAWGYVRVIDELARDLASVEGGLDRPTTVICATGSGGTQAGLILGVKLLGLGLRVAGVNVCDDRSYFLAEIGRICGRFRSAFAPHLDFDAVRDIDMVDGYVGRGYALARPEELEELRDLARLEGVVFDPVYTGKAYYGVVQELKKDPGRFGKRIVFVHTGGIFGLFPFSSQIEPLLDGGGSDEGGNK